MLSTLVSRINPIKQLRRGNAGDAVFAGLALIFALVLLAITLGLIVELWVESAASRQEFGLSFIWSRAWDIQGEKFGALTFIYGTLVTSFFAIFLAGPIGVGIAAYLVEIAPLRLNRIVGFVVEMLAAVPSIVYGFWGITVLGPFLGHYVAPYLSGALGWLPIFAGSFNNASVFTASLVLTIMVLPTVAAISRDVIRAVPDEQREAMLALGATRWEMFRGAVFPNARAGILGAIALGMGRAAGETMAVTLIIGNNPQLFKTLFQQGATMSSIIAASFQEASGLFRASLLEIGLILFVITFAINVGARLTVRWLSGPEGGRV